jgi:hypothetical protein
MRIISTSGDRFDKQMALRLQKSAKALELDCELVRWTGEFLPSRDRIRFLTLQRVLSERPGEDLLYIDPAAQLLRRPDVLLDEKDFDLAVYFDSSTLAASGPLFLRRNPHAEAFIAAWGVLNEAFPEDSDLENLSQVLAQPPSGLVIRRLPVTYAWIEARHRKNYPDAQPVIVHYQTDGMISTNGKKSKE